MATTGAVLYVRPYPIASSFVGRGVSAVMYVSARMQTGVYTVGVSSTQAINVAQWLPPPREPLGIVQADGRVLIAPVWWRFLNFVCESKLGGVAGQTVTDITTGVDEAKTATAQVAAQAAAVAQQTQANAEALAVVVQVANNNVLDGADQIPPVRLSPGESIP